MNPLLRTVLLEIVVYSISACSGQSGRSACALMNLDDAKSIIGADAALQKEQSSADHCYYRSSAGETYLHVSNTSGHLWTDYKTAGKHVKSAGDEAYFYPAGNPWGNTLMVRKGDTAIQINAWVNSLSDEVIQNEELAFSQKMASRL